MPHRVPSLSRRQALSSLGAGLLLPAFAGLAGAGAVRRARSAGPETARFLAAVRAGDVGTVRALLAEDATLAAARDGAGRSAFVLASVAGHGEVAEVLRAAGIELDLVEAVLAEDWPRFEELAQAAPELLDAAHPVGGTPLYAAALVGGTSNWRLRGAGCRPDAAPAGGSGFTPARGAMESVRPEWAWIALTDLCGNGGDVNARQRGGSSVLHGAVLRRDERLVRTAIRKGADAEARDDGGRTARVLAAELGWAEGERLLAGAGALPRDDRSSRYALDASGVPCERADLSDVPQELQSEVTGSSHTDLARVRELVGRDGRLVWSVSTDDELAIEASAHMGNHDLIRFHLDHGAPLSLPTAVALGDLAAVEGWLERSPGLVHERGAHDFPVMWYAALGGGSVEMAELLLAYGADVDQESVGATALHWCVKRGHPDLLRFLLEAGADPEALGYRWRREGDTPLGLAEAAGASRLAALLREGGARR